MDFAVIKIIIVLVIWTNDSSAKERNDEPVNKAIGQHINHIKHGNILSVEGKCVFDDRCTCKKFNRTTNTEVADCSRKEFSAIPKIGTDIVIITLSYNFISSIEECIFMYAERLQELDLSSNIISALLDGSFIGLTNLQILNLRSNRLVYTDGVFGVKSFYPLKNLRSLNIENNLDFFTKGHVYPTFSHLRRLETLILDGVNDEMLGRKLQNLNSLKYFKISESTGNCVINNLPRTVFNNTLNLEMIEISGCNNWNTIEKGTFCHLSNLSYLDLSYNTQLEFTNMQNVFDDLPFTSIRYLKINKIYATDHLTTKVSTNLLKPLQNTSLEEVELNRNRVQTVEEGAFLNLPKTLKRISATDNPLAYGSYVIDSMNLTITSLTISHIVELHAFTDGRISTKKRNIILPDTVKNRLPKLPKNVSINKSLLSFNAPTTFPPQINFFEQLYFSENFNIFQSLKYLDFSHNFCSDNMLLNMAGKMVNMETLLINNNLLKVVIENIEGLQGKLLKLKTLNLSHNKIAFIRPLFFKSQVSLQHLDLSNNALSNVDFEVDHMANLTYLDLSNNQIKYLAPKILQSLEAINNLNENLTVNMAGNPIVCSCFSIDFIKWLSDTQIHLQNLHDYKCAKTDGTELDFKDPNIAYNILHKECSQFGYLIATVAICVLIFLIVVLSGVVYRFRWKLRYLYYMTKQRHNRNLLLQNDISDFRYDAFVSYSDHDQSFVHGEMLEQLETNFGLNLCLHKRDFLPGHDIAGNITNAIHESLKTVVVLSENYLKSDWCMFEFNMARMETIYSRKGENVLFLLIYKTVPTSDVPLQLLELMQSETYIEYHEDNELFWSKIKDVLTM